MTRPIQDQARSWELWERPGSENPGSCLNSEIPFLEILKLHFGIEEGEREYAITKKMKDKLTELDEELVPITLSAFQDLLSLKIEDETWLYLEPKEKRNRTFEAIRNLLISVSRKRPLVVAIEDLHWMVSRWGWWI